MEVRPVTSSRERQQTELRLRQKPLALRQLGREHGGQIPYLPRRTAFQLLQDVDRVPYRGIVLAQVVGFCPPHVNPFGETVSPRLKAATDTRTANPAGCALVTLLVLVAESRRWRRLRKIWHA
ncbi:MAG: hypothetical protein L0H31_05100 [Nocardioidaceae bacterium]|nr:hypothetical protein [Nocardioidaceae bacterium]